MSTARVAIFTGARSDLGPLGPVIGQLAHSPDLDPVVLAGVGHSRDELRNELNRVAAGEVPTEVLIGPPPGDDSESISRFGPDLQTAVTAALLRIRPRSLVVLGDRWELLYVVPAAVLLATPVVHLHGGEVTEGALDERVRHAVTKLADQHCVATEDAARRLRRMGEGPARVHVTGAPGLDRFTDVGPISPEEFEALFGVPLRRPVVLLTYHPPTAVGDSSIAEWARAIIDETAAVAATVLATAPGLDPGHAQIVAELRAATQRHPNVLLVNSLGHRYPQVLATVDAMVGNSSSGIIEAASFQLPVLDVGDRQKGRLRGENVITVPEGAGAVRTGLRYVLDPAFRDSLSGLRNPYGDGHAAKLIAQVVRDSTVNPPSPKEFHDDPEHR